MNDNDKRKVPITKKVLGLKEARYKEVAQDVRYESDLQMESSGRIGQLPGPTSII